MTDRIGVNFASPDTDFFLEADVVQTDAAYGANGRWLVRFYLRAVNRGTASSNYGGSGFQAAQRSLGGTWSEVFRHSGNPFLPSGYGTNATRWRDGPGDVWVVANSNGYWYTTLTAMPVMMPIAYGSINSSPTGSVPMPRIARAPGAPGTPVASALTPTSATLSWTAAARGNANITNYQWRIGTTAAMTTVVASSPNLGVVLSDDTANDVTLSPGTTYYAQIRAINGDGYTWSAVQAFTTLPATPPSIAVTPSLDGKSANLVLSPPSGTTGVSKYTVESRIFGTTTPVSSFETTSTTPVVSDLTPGVRYEWRAAAWFGTYQSPFSNPWLAVQQPNPNTSPGSYFDGNTTATPDTTFAWTGTVNNSISTASGKRATGWLPFANAAAVSGGTGAQQRVTGAVGVYPDGSPTGQYAARYTFFTDAAAAGFLAGTSGDITLAAEVSAGGTYYGQIAGSLSRVQRVAAVIIFLNPAGVETSRVVGTPFTTVAGQKFVALTSGLAAADGFAQVALIDVNDTDPTWSTYKGGDEVFVDAAMITVGQNFPYFDGAAPDSANFLYDWTGAANASTSTRTALDVIGVDPLADPDCPPLPMPPSPPVIEDECIVEVGVWRRYWVQVPSTEVARWITMLPTITLTSGRGAPAGSPPDGVRQVRIRYFPNPDELSPSAFTDTDSWEAEQIVSYLPPYSIMTLDAVSQRVWVQIGDSVTDPNTAPAVAGDHLLYGTGGGPATWPALSCDVGYLISLDVPLGADLGNLVAALALTERML